MFELEAPADLLLGLLTGVAFGFLLQKGRVAKYQTILGQLLPKEWTAFKIMFTAVVTGAIGVYAMLAAGEARLDIWPFQPAAMLLGAAAFGVGIALLGYCPGTGMAGAGVFVVGHDALEPVALSLGDWGKLTAPDALGISAWLVIVPMTVALALSRRYLA